MWISLRFRQKRRHKLKENLESNLCFRIEALKLAMCLTLVHHFFDFVDFKDFITPKEELMKVLDRYVVFLTFS